MIRSLLVLLILTVGCTGAAPDAGVGPDASPDLGPDLGRDLGARPDVTPDLDVESIPTDSGNDSGEPPVTTPIVLQLGARTEPFEPWPESADLIVVEGPQGGFHTEHAAQIVGASLEELHLAIIWGEVWRDDLVLVSTGWEFWEEQWKPSGEGFSVELPVLIFDDQPALGPAELRGRAELPDGRTTEFELLVNLVAAP